MQLKRYDKAGSSVVWSHSKNYSDILASTSINPYNPNLSDIELLSIDFGSRSKELNVMGRALYNSPFRCLAWGTFGQRDESLPYGLIFGGMQNGSFTLWNPAEMIGVPTLEEGSISEQSSLIFEVEAEEQSHPILCAEWNNLKNNFLAYGSTNLLLLDVGKDVSNPDVLQSGQNNPHEGSYISSVSWNKQVAHILASAGSDGLIALWDIKTNKSIFQFKDSAPSHYYRQVEIAWSKHISTQIAVTLDDEKKNQLQIWDLRNQKGPIVVIDKIHSKGINSIDWSDIDHDLILASSRDRKVVCWNYKQDQTPINITNVSEDIVNVSWSHHLSSIYSITTQKGVEIYSMDDKNLHSYVPKWLKVPVGSCFNGNDGLMVYSEQKGNIIQEFAIKTQPKKSIQKSITELDNYFENNLEPMKSLGGDEGKFWELICAKANSGEDADIYNFLGFNKDKVISEVEKYTGKKRSTHNETKSKKKAKVPQADYIPVENAASFFGNLGSTLTHEREQSDNEIEAEIKYDTVKLNNNWNIGRQRLIKHNMLIGNYEGAIDAALKCGRTAEALIIAYSVDQNTFNNTLKTFFTETTDHFISDILKHIAFKDNEELVLRYDLNKWKECVALVYSISSSSKRKSLLKLLGERICKQQQNNQNLKEAGIFCLILAEEFQCIVSQYNNRLKSYQNNLNERKTQVIHFCTKLIAIYDSLSIQVKQSPAFERILRETAFVCLQAGKKLMAYNIFTKFLSNTSFRFIDYLVNTTEELSQYKNKSLNVVSLPIMARKQLQQDKKKKIPKKQIHHYQQAPVNIRPPNPPHKPFPPSAQSHQLVEQQQASKSQLQLTKQATRNRNNPPPPPKKKTTPQVIPSFGHKQSQESQWATSHEQTLPPPPKNAKKGPPPPPKTPSKDIQPYAEEEKRHVAPTNPHAPPKKMYPTQPPPPPGPKVYKQPSQPEKIKSPPQTPQNSTRTPPPPPPPQKIKNLNKSYRQEEINSSTELQKQHSPPPPPPPTKTRNIQPPQPNKQMIKQPMTKMVPPKHQQVKAQQEEYSQNEDQYQPQEQRLPVQQRRNPPPPPGPKARGIPRPPAPIQNSHHNTQQTEEVQKVNEGTKNIRKVPPPRPPGRR